MSYRRATVQARPPTALDLERRLADELRTPSEDAAAQPIIIAGPPEPAPISRLHVVWDDWEDLSIQERSEIIMNAFIAVNGPDAGAGIIVALGLTSPEARRMRVG